MTVLRQSHPKTKVFENQSYKNMEILQNINLSQNIINIIISAIFFIVAFTCFVDFKREKKKE